MYIMEKFLVVEAVNIPLCVWVYVRVSLLIQQNSEAQQRAASSPGFLWTAVLCYVKLLQLFVERPTGNLLDSQVTEVSHNQTLTL